MDAYRGIYHLPGVGGAGSVWKRRMDGLYGAAGGAGCRGFAGSLLTLAARENGTLVGLLRAVGDGCTVVLVQDLLVRPDHQRRGIGTALMQAALERFRSVRQVQLLTDDTEKTKGFYRSLGLTLPELGCCGFMRPMGESVLDTLPMLCPVYRAVSAGSGSAAPAGSGFWFWFCLFCFC